MIEVLDKLIIVYWSVFMVYMVYMMIRHMWQMEKLTKEFEKIVKRNDKIIDTYSHFHRMGFHESTNFILTRLQGSI